MDVPFAFEDAKDRHALELYRHVQACLARLHPAADLPPEAQAWLSHAISLVHRQYRGLVPGLEYPLVPRPGGAPLAVLGWIDDAPVAAAIAVWVQSKVRPPLSTQVVALLVAQALGPDGLPDLAAHADTVREAGRAVRAMVRGDIVMPPATETTREAVVVFLRQFVQGSPALETTADAGALEPADATRTLAQRYVRALITLLEGVCAMPQASTHRPPHPALRVAPTPGQSDSRSSDLVDAMWEQRHVLVQGIPAQDDLDTGEGGEPLHEVPRSLGGSEIAIRPRARRALEASELRAARARNTGVEVARLDGVTPAAISDLGEALEQVANDEAGARIALLLALYSGEPLTRMGEWSVVAAGGSAPTGAWALRAEPVELCIPTTALDTWLPQMPLSLRATPLPQSRHVRIPVSLHAFGGAWLRDWVRQRAAGGPVVDAGDLDGARQLLAARQRTHDNPLTPRRMPSALRQALHAVGAGLAECALLHGRLPAHASAAAPSYYAPQLPEIARVGLAAMEKLSDWLGGAPVLAPVLQLPRERVGATRCPSDDELVQAAAQLEAAVARLPRGRPHRGTYAAYHRRVQATYFQSMCLALGVRPSVHALEGVVASLGIAIVDEKAKPGAATRSAARIVPLPKPLDAWALKWRVHREWIIQRCGLEGELPPFFRVDASGDWRPAAVADLIPTAWPLVRNGARHAWRTGVARAGMPGRSAERALGHWGLGGEPGMCGSFASPLAPDAWAAAVYLRALHLPDPWGTHG